jgi:hypothetical protein
MWLRGVDSLHILVGKAPLSDSSSSYILSRISGITGYLVISEYIQMAEWSSSPEARKNNKNGMISSLNLMQTLIATIPTGISGRI